MVGEKFPTIVNGAYVVLLTSNNYFLGVKVLHWSLKSVNSAYPLLVLYTSDLSEKNILELTTSGCIMKKINYTELGVDVDTDQYAQSYYRDNWTKLQVFNLTEYSRVAVLDADMLVRQNVDDLMTLDIPDGWIAASPGCVCNPMKVTSYPENWCPENCPYTYENQPELQNNFAYLNGGLLVLNPSLEAYNKILNKLKKIQSLDKYQFAEQDFLNEVYQKKWIRLPYSYNALRPLMISHPKMWNVDEIRIVHYIFTKPWLDKEWNEQSDEERRKNKFYTVNSWWFEAYEKSKVSSTII